MNAEQQTQSQFGNRTFARQPPGWLGKLGAALLSAALLVVAFMFSLAALAVVAVVGVVLGAWLWWKMRSLRKILRTQAEQYAPPETASACTGRIIEGEVVDRSTPVGDERLLRRD